MSTGTERGDIHLILYPFFCEFGKGSFDRDAITGTIEEPPVGASWPAKLSCAELVSSSADALSDSAVGSFFLVSRSSMLVCGTAGCVQEIPLSGCIIWLFKYILLTTFDLEFAFELFFLSAAAML